VPFGRDVGLGSGDIVLDGVPAPPLPKGHSPNFWPMSIVVKRSPISATAEHLFAINTTSATYHSFVAAAGAWKR